MSVQPDRFVCVVSGAAEDTVRVMEALLTRASIVWRRGDTKEGTRLLVPRRHAKVARRVIFDSVSTQIRKLALVKGSLGPAATGQASRSPVAGE